MLFKAVTRNMELEMTIKTLNSNVHEPTDSNVHRVNVLNNTANNTADNSSSTNTTNDNTSCDDLVAGIRDRVTRFILSKIDAELDKLQNGDLALTLSSLYWNYWYFICICIIST
jgi:hypothetical protein